MDTSRVRNYTQFLTSGIETAAGAGATAQALSAGLRRDGHNEDLATPWTRSSVPTNKFAEKMPSSLTVTLANQVCFDKSQLPQSLANRLIRLAAFQNPEFHRAQAMRLSVWDKPRIIGCAENYPQHIALPRGCFDAAAELLAANDIRCDLNDERIAGTPIDVDFVGTLRPDQEAAVSATMHHDSGVLCAPTAFGKTVTAASMIARRSVNTLALVHRTELLKQWQERLQAFLGAGRGVIGTFGGGKAKPTGVIDIAVMQSVSRQGEVNPLVENYGHVIVDECHHVGAVSVDAILRRTKAKFVLGLTATPIRRDRQQPIIFMQCGPVRHTAAKPVGSPHDLEVVPRSLFVSIDLPAGAGIQDVFRHLANDAVRTEAIAAEVGAAAERGRKTYPTSSKLSTGELAIRRLQRRGFERALAVLDDASGPEVVPSDKEADKRQGAAMLR